MNRNIINLTYRRRLLEEAMQVTDIRDYRAQKAFREAYVKNIEAEERLVDLDKLLDGAETR